MLTSRPFVSVKPLANMQHQEPIPPVYNSGASVPVKIQRVELCTWIYRVARKVIHEMSNFGLMQSTLDTFKRGTTDILENMEKRVKEEKNKTASLGEKVEHGYQLIVDAYPEIKIIVDVYRASHIDKCRKRNEAHAELVAVCRMEVLKTQEDMAQLKRHFLESYAHTSTMKDTFLGIVEEARGNVSGGEFATMTFLREIDGIVADEYEAHCQDSLIHHQNEWESSCRKTLDALEARMAQYLTCEETGVHSSLGNLCSQMSTQSPSLCLQLHEFMKTCEQYYNSVVQVRDMELLILVSQIDMDACFAQCVASKAVFSSMEKREWHAADEGERDLILSAQTGEATRHV